ncbi:serine hydrolase [Streptomyces montanus]|uniref:Serine hydrolase n=2 Tax=Streptomyces montanus TaxID=2580423 RepID=A0A5R9FSN1_9ACTN|nr:serine hydrolase [Streptomyces montanus]
MALPAGCSSAGTVKRPPPRKTAPAAPAMGPAAPREGLGAALARSIEPVLSDDEARLAVAVLRLDDADRQIASFGDRATFDTASIVKVNILATLLLQAQEKERELTDKEHRHAKVMIQASDNEAANVLWRAIGRAPGLDAANEKLGLSSTQGGHGARWGLTQTTAEDQVRLLREVFGGEGTMSSRGSAGLNQKSRAYIRQLMSEITEGQDWGVSAAAGSRWALKNGWLKRSTTELWDINSIGQVTVHGRRYLISVLSGDNASMAGGISLVERAAKAAVGAVSTRAWPRPWLE